MSIPTKENDMTNLNLRIENGTITKRVEIVDDPKRIGLLYSRHYDENDRKLGTSWGKKNQTYIKGLIEIGVPLDENH
jgi:hypothetical protein